MARIARKQPEVAYTYTSVSTQGDSVDEGKVFVKLSPKAERTRRQAAVVNDIRRELQTLGGITASISTGFNQGEKQIQLQVRGPEARELSRVAEAVADGAARRCPGRSTWACRPRARSPSSTSRSIAAWPARSA